MGMSKGKASYPYTGLDRPLGLQEFDDPEISRHSAHEGVNACRPTHQPTLPPPPEDTPLTHFT